jgi:hypothetical protein
MLSPIDHYAAADQLLATEIVKRDPTLPIARAMVAQAAVHAALAQCSVDQYLQAKYQGQDCALGSMVTADVTGDRL